MVYLVHTPKPPLSDFVELFWSNEGYNPPHARERILPTGTTELVINLLNDEIRVSDRRNLHRPRSFRRSLICGPHSEYFVIDTTQQSSMVGIHFKPGGNFPCLRLPASELRDTSESLDVLWGSDADELRDQLLEAETPEARFRVLERNLLARIESLPARHPAVAFALKEFRTLPHTQTITQITNRAGISQRHFIRLFNDEVGLTPKVFCRIQRFQEVLRLAESRKPIRWAEFALACGYFDQAHLIGDFRAFSGLTPTAYLCARGERSNHIPFDYR